MWRRLSWWIADYAYAAHWQVRAAIGRRDPADFRTGVLVPVIIIPGVYETWRFMQPLVTVLHGRGHPVHVVETLSNNRRPVLETARLVTEVMVEQGMTDAVIVAHSKGGLAGKAVMTGTEGRRVRAMIAVAAPFGGSRYARLFPARSVRAFAPSDPDLLDLARRREVNDRIVSVYASFDPHIPEGSELAGARKNVRLDTGGHFRILADPRVLDEIAAVAEA